MGYQFFLSSIGDALASWFSKRWITGTSISHASMVKIKEKPVKICHLPILEHHLYFLSHRCSISGLDNLSPVAFLAFAASGFDRDGEPPSVLCDASCLDIKHNCSGFQPTTPDGINLKTPLSSRCYWHQHKYVSLNNRKKHTSTYSHRT